MQLIQKYTAARKPRHQCYEVNPIPRWGRYERAEVKQSARCHINAICHFLNAPIAEILDFWMHPRLPLATANLVSHIDINCEAGVSKKYQNHQCSCFPIRLAPQPPKPSG